jgi:hypothetical protein
MASTEPLIWSLAWWDQIAPLIQAVVVLVTGGVAVRGLSAWRDQMIAKRKAELAEEVLTSFYKARDVFIWVRTAVSFGSEGESRKAGETETDQVRSARNFYFIPIERLSHERELFAKLHAQRYAFRAYFGDESSKPFETLWRAHTKVMSTAGTLIELAKFGDAHDSVVRSRTDLLNDLGWGMRERPDQMDQELDSAVAAIEGFCRPILEGRRS